MPRAFLASRYTVGGSRTEFSISVFKLKPAWTCARYLYQRAKVWLAWAGDDSPEASEIKLSPGSCMFLVIRGSPVLPEHERNLRL